MSQSATLYRVSYEKFKELKDSDIIDLTNINAISKDSLTFLGSFMGIEFILAKGQDQKTASLISEIFYPNEELSNSDIEYLPLEDQNEIDDQEVRIPYLDSSTISRLNEFLVNFSETDVHSGYDSKELNDNGIYPGIWHNDNADNLVFNKRQILNDITKLKNLFYLANKEKDYILVFVG